METICDAETFAKFLLHTGWVIGELSPEFKGSIEYITPGNGGSVRLVFDKSFADYDRRLNETFDEVAAALGIDREALDYRVGEFISPFYPRGTDLLWMAHYRKEPDSGAMDGFSSKISGTLIEAAAKAEEIGRKNNAVLQCLRRRY